MNPKRWHRVEQIYNSVLERNPEERDAYLEKVCAGDEALRKEVESLLACNDEAEAFIESPAMDEAAKALAEDSENRDSFVGRTLLHYSLLERIGEGGMGVVYKAHDNRLNRDIAIKVLPDIFAQDPQRLARFEREARAVAALSNPNILGIFDLCTADGVTFAAMELLEGETLRDRLKETSLPVRKAIDYAMQMAQGLAGAHERGVVHRDLKPENVFITKEGRIKILDFGLAKLRRDTGSAAEASTSLTSPGVLMGTVGYMSPEQVRGQDAGARSDIFALGAILYEMLSGERAFQGDSEADTIGAILKEDPPELTHLQKRISPAIERVVRRCLEKNPAERFQSARDLSFALEAVHSDSETPAPTDKLPGRARWSRRTWVIATAGVLVIMIGIAYWINRRGAEETRDEPLIPVPFTTYPGMEFAPSFSPDGNQVAFVWAGEKQDNLDIYIKQIGSESPRQLTTDPHDDFNPAWSPDGQSIGFLRGLGQGKAGVMLIPANGGRERQVAELQRQKVPHADWRLCWHPRARWLGVACDQVSADQPSAIFLLSPDTGERRQLTFPPKGIRGDTNPAFSPDGRSLAFSRFNNAVASEIYVLRVGAGFLPEGEPKQLTFGDALSTFPAWMPDGMEIIYTFGSQIHHSSLWRVSLSGSGKPRPLPFSGETIAICPAISLEKHRMVYSVLSWDFNVWQYQIPAGKEKPGLPSRFMASTRTQHEAQYSPDGEEVAYLSFASGSAQIWVSSKDGTNPLQLTHMAGPAPDFPRWSPDGKQIVFHMVTGGESDVFLISAQGGQIKQLTHTPFNEDCPSFSHDGKWIYFGLNRNGDLQVWKMPVEGGESVQLTRKGGDLPQESIDGKMVFYLKQKNQAVSELWEVPVEGGEEIRVLGDVLVTNFDVKQSGIYYAAPPDAQESRFLFYDFAKRKAKIVATIHQEVLWGFTVSPDESRVLYIPNREVRIKAT